MPIIFENRLGNSESDKKLRKIYRLHHTFWTLYYIIFFAGFGFGMAILVGVNGNLSGRKWQSYLCPYHRCRHCWSACFLLQETNAPEKRQIGQEIQVFSVPDDPLDYLNRTRTSTR